MTTSAISFVVKNLSTLIQNEVGLLWGVDKEMKKLSSTLSTILAVLDDAEMKQHQEKAIQDWLRKLKDAAYEVSDILDDCQTHFLRSGMNGQGSSFLKKVWISAKTRYPVVDLLFRHRIANRMKDIIMDINEISEERKMFHLNEGFMGKVLTLGDESRETGSSLPGSEMLGREEDKEKIVKVLTEEVCDLKELSVYPVIGMGGLGKTTLAQMVFHDERIISHFVLKVWVYVSQDFNVKRVMKQIIESTSGGETCKSTSLDSLQNEVKKRLSGKRYLLVLDDAWSEDQEEWETLMHVLACGFSGSCVVVTSRSEKVASIIKTLPTHKLSYLSEDDCWLLLRQRAFAPGHEECPDLVAIGKEIVKKCGGVPLAAKALGGLLRFRRGDKEWISVKESELWNIQDRECFFLPALRLSYYNLPLELRRCFSYCAVFLKGSLIGKEQLIHLWMANGFISSRGKLEVEDVGNGFWNELSMRSFFQEEERDLGGNIYFKMHDLMHDLAQFVMEDECHIVEANRFGSVPTKRIRHATLVNNRGHDGAFPEALNTHRSLHTIMLQHKEHPGIYSDTEFATSFEFKSFCSLRVFDANEARMTRLPESIGRSKHLRYLNLSKTLIKELPESICELSNLQTLDLDGCWRLRRLPEKMHYLRGLRHLCLESCDMIDEMPPQLRNLTQLRTLSLFLVGESSGRRLGELHHLDLGGRLDIKHLARVSNIAEAKDANLAGKHNLRVLGLLYQKYWSKSRSQENISEEEQVIEALEPHPNIEVLTIKCYRGKEFPIWMGNPSVLKNVVAIQLIRCRNCLRLPALGQLPCLKRLLIIGMDEAEYLIQNSNNSTRVVTSSTGAFPSLEILKIEDLPNLRGFSMDGEGQDQQQQVLPRLRKIYIESCPQLIFPPLSCLESLNISACNNMGLVTSISEQTSLTKLSLSKEDVICSVDEMLKNLPLLQTLRIRACRQLKLLPEDMSSLVALKKLSIDGCENLECLPDGGIRSLSSLLEMKISCCLKIVSLPDSIQSLTQLQSLELSDCSEELKRRCEVGRGEDWSKISHVPKLEIW